MVLGVCSTYSMACLLLLTVVCPKMGFRAALEALSLSYLSGVYISALRGTSGLSAWMYVVSCR